MNKKLTGLICLVLSVITAISFSACKKPNGESDNGAGVNNPEVTYVNLDINPEIELTVDANEKVVTVYGVNEDGKVLLVNESLEGKSLEEAVEKITSLAVELGYLTEDNKVVTTSVSSSNNEKVNEVLSKINSKVTATAENLGLEVKTDLEGAFSIVRKLEKYKAKNPNNQLIQALSVGKFKLALSASETGEVSLDVAVTLDEKELIDLINKERKEVKEVVTDAYNKAKAQALLIYDRAVSEILDGIYAGYYLENLMKYPTTFWYGHSYQVYKTMERCFGALSNVMKYAEKASEYPLDEQTVTQVLEIFGLGVEEVDKLKNSDGKITLSSIESYADVVIKNASKDVDLSQLKEQLNTVLTEIDQKLLADVNEEIKKYQPQIDQIVLSVETAINTLKTATAVIPDSLKTELNTFVSDVQSVITSLKEDVENGEINSVKLKDYADNAGKKATETLTKIENTLSEEDKAEIEQRVKAVETSLNNAKQKMQDTLTQAEKDVKDKLQDLKEQRRPKK